MIIKCRCGTPLEVDEDMFGEEIQCPRCHMTMIAPTSPASAPPSKRSEFTPTPRPPSHLSVPPQPGPASPPQTGPGPTSSKAIACLHLGIASMTVPFVLVIPSILFGLLAFRDCREHRMQGKAMAVMGMILAVFSTLCMGSAIYFAYPWIKQAVDLSKGLKDGGDITKLLNKGAAGVDSSGQLNDPKTKADFLYAQGILKFGVPDLQTTNRLREIRDMDRLNRIENALRTANTWQELLATP